MENRNCNCVEEIALDRHQNPNNVGMGDIRLRTGATNANPEDDVRHAGWKLRIHALQLDSAPALCLLKPGS
eukprot:4763286-Amphidinium_carterae.1